MIKFLRGIMMVVNVELVGTRLLEFDVWKLIIIEICSKFKEKVGFYRDTGGKKELSNIINLSLSGYVSMFAWTFNFYFFWGVSKNGR